MFVATLCNSSCAHVPIDIKCRSTNFVEWCTESAVDQLALPLACMHTHNSLLFLLILDLMQHGFNSPDPSPVVLGYRMLPNVDECRSCMHPRSIFLGALYSMTSKLGRIHAPKEYSFGMTCAVYLAIGHFTI